MQILSLVSSTPRLRPATDSGPRQPRHHEIRRPALRVTVAAAVLLLAAAPALPAASASHPHGRVAAQIDRFLTTQLKQSAIPGAAVAVTRGDRVLLVRGYGRDSAEAPVTEDSLFRIASLSKSFTALAVMQLVDAGRLRLDDPVRQLNRTGIDGGSGVSRVPRRLDFWIPGA